MQIVDGQSEPILGDLSPLKSWKTTYAHPIFCLTNQFLPYQAYFYHLHERDLMQEKGKAGLIKLNLPHRTLSAFAF